jgi:hypothetical protein
VKSISLIQSARKTEQRVFQQLLVHDDPSWALEYLVFQSEFHRNPLFNTSLNYHFGSFQSRGGKRRSVKAVQRIEMFDSVRGDVATRSFETVVRQSRSKEDIPIESVKMKANDKQF